MHTFPRQNRLHFHVVGVIVFVIIAQHDRLSVKYPSVVNRKWYFDTPLSPQSRVERLMTYLRTTTFFYRTSSLIKIQYRCFN